MLQLMSTVKFQVTYGLGSRCSSTKGPSRVSSPRRDGFTWPPYNQYGIALHQAVVYTVKEALTWGHFPTNSIPMWPWFVTCEASMFVFPTFPPIFRGLSFSRIESCQITKICRGGDETWGFHKMKPLAKGLGVVPSAKSCYCETFRKSQGMKMCHEDPPAPFSFKRRASVHSRRRPSSAPAAPAQLLLRPPTATVTTNLQDRPSATNPPQVEGRISGVSCW